MSAIQLNSVTNANVYAGADNWVGRLEEIDLPEIEFLTAEYKPLGLVGKLKLPTGGIDEMKGKFKWNSFYRDAFMKVANPRQTIPLQCRSSVQAFGGGGVVSEVPMVTFLTVLFTKFPLGSFKQNDPAEFPTEFTCYYIKQSVGGVDLLEIDVMSNIFTVSGEDLLKNYRTHLGV
jgi:P2 family phage contractile tail tube protein